MNCESPWDRLLASLRSWADAREVTDGIEVSFTSGAEQRTVEIALIDDAETTGTVSVMRTEAGKDSGPRFREALRLPLPT